MAINLKTHGERGILIEYRFDCKSVKQDACFPKVERLHDQTIPLLGIYIKSIKPVDGRRDAFVLQCSAVQWRTADLWDQLSCSSADE